MPWGTSLGAAALDPDGTVRGSTGRDHHDDDREEYHCGATISTHPWSAGGGVEPLCSSAGDGRYTVARRAADAVTGVKRQPEVGGDQMRRVPGRALWAMAAVLVLATAAACGSGSSSSNNGGGTGGGGGGSAATPVNSSTCKSVVNPNGQLLITSDLPLNGSSSHQTTQMNQAIEMIFEQAGWKAGKYTIAVPALRRLDAAGGDVGLDDVLGERQRVRSGPVGHRQHRHVQLGLRRARGPGAEPGSSLARSPW